MVGRLISCDVLYQGLPINGSHFLFHRQLCKIAPSLHPWRAMEIEGIVLWLPTGPAGRLALAAGAISGATASCIGFNKQ